MNKIKQKRINFWAGRGLIFAFCLLPFAFPPQAAAHRYHTTLTRMDYKAEDKNIEITIQLFIHDLENVMERYAKKRIDAGKTKDIDQIIEKYLEENFVLKNKKDEKLKLKWVGKELNVDTAFVYLEASSEESIEGYKLQNTIFFESFSEQTNLLTARFENKKVDLLYKAGDKFKSIAAIKTKTIRGKIRGLKLTSCYFGRVPMRVDWANRQSPILFLNRRLRKSFSGSNEAYIY